MRREPSISYSFATSRMTGWAAHGAAASLDFARDALSDVEGRGSAASAWRETHAKLRRASP